MDVYAFRLDDPTSQAFRGIVAIFNTKVQEVWHRLAIDDRAHQVPHSVMQNEASPLREELKALAKGTRLEGGPSLLSQLFSDPAVSHNHRVTFVDRRRFSMVAYTEESFRSQVDHWYERVASSHRG
jgi:hypothetical protein